jgi:hypothetical protein
MVRRGLPGEEELYADACYETTNATNPANDKMNQEKRYGYAAHNRQAYRENRYAVIERLARLSLDMPLRDYYLVRWNT